MKNTTTPFLYLYRVVVFFSLFLQSINFGYFVRYSEILYLVEIAAAMGTKTGDEKFGHALHDDLTLSAICKVS